MTEGNATFAAALEVALFAKMAADYPATKMFTPNADFKAPPTGAYCSYAMINATAMEQSIGSTKIERTPFVLKISVFAQVGKNDRAYVAMAEDIGRVFAGTTMTIALGHAAYFRAVTVNSGPEQKDGKYHVIATIMGHRDLTL